MEIVQKKEFKKAEKGQRKLAEDGYIYVFKKMLANDISSWECILRRKDGQCRATIKLSPTDEFIEQVNDHIHPPSSTKVEVTKINIGMKRKAKTTEETVQQILGEQLGNSSNDATTKLPLIAAMERNIR